MTIPQFVAGSVLEAAQLNVIVDALNAGGGKMEVQQFTADGTFTVPAGVTHAVAHITAGGAGGGATAAAGGNSSVAFAGGTITATGGAPRAREGNGVQQAGAPNSGEGAMINVGLGNADGVQLKQGNGATIVAGAEVTPAASITVTVGAGGAAGTGGAAGGSGYVWIEYQV